MPSMRSRKRIKDMIENLRSMQADQQYQAQIYPISDAIAALEWVLGKKQVLNIGTCSCRFIQDLNQSDAFFNQGKGSRVLSSMIKSLQNKYDGKV